LDIIFRIVKLKKKEKKLFVYKQFGSNRNYAALQIRKCRPWLATNTHSKCQHSIKPDFFEKLIRKIKGFYVYLHNLYFVQYSKTVII